MTARPAFHDHYTSIGLADASPAQYSSDAALLDRLWAQAHQARDEPVLNVAAWAGLAPGKRAAAVLYPHAAARWAWFANGAAALDWGRDRRRAPCSTPRCIEPAHSTGVLITRLNGTLQWQPLDAAGHAFLCLFADGGTLAQAEAAARAASPATDADKAGIAPLAATLVTAGAFSRMSMTRPTRATSRRAWRFFG